MSTYKPNAAEAAWIRELAGILDETGLTEVEIQKADLRVRVSRSVSGAPVAYAASAPMPSAPVARPKAEAPAAGPDRSKAVASPMVGTVYLSPSPGTDPFVKAGDTVTAGQTLMIIEAMKTMNPIPAPRAGAVREIIVRDSQPVEFGEPLIVIE